MHSNKLMLFIVLIFPFVLSAQFKKKLTNIVAKTESAVFNIYSYNEYGNPENTGSGFFISNDGIALTNHHVIDDTKIGFIKTHDNKVFQIDNLIEVDTIADVAKIKINSGDFKFNFLKISNKNIRKGQEIFVIGNPNGLENVVSNGIVSAIRENITFTEIQFTAPISPGSSGSPIFDMNGNVIGIVTSSFGGDNQNLNFGTLLDNTKLYSPILSNKNLTTDTKLIYKNLINRNDFSVVLKTIEISEKLTKLRLTFSNFNLAWDTYIIGSSIGDEASWRLKNINTKNIYPLVYSSLGTMGNPTQIPYGFTQEFELHFLPFKEDIVDSINILNDEFGSNWSFLNISTNSNYPDLNYPKTPDMKFSYNENKESLSYYKTAALLAIAEKKYDDALYYLDNIQANIENKSQEAYYCQLIASIYLSFEDGTKNDTIEALNNLEESIANDASHHLYHFNSYYLNYHLNNKEKALSNISAAIAIVPDYLYYRRMRYELNWELNNYRDVYNDADYCIKNAVYNVQADDYLYRAISLENMEKGYGNEESCEDYKSAINLSKDLDYKDWVKTEFLKDCD